MTLTSTNTGPTLLAYDIAMWHVLLFSDAFDKVPSSVIFFRFGEEHPLAAVWSGSYGVACQFQVWSPLAKMLPPVVHWFVSHTMPVAAARPAAGSGVAPP